MTFRTHTDLTRAHRAPVILQHPDLTAVLDFPTMEAVPRAVLPVRAPAVVSTIQVKANGVVGTAVPARPALVDIYSQEKPASNMLRTCSVSHDCSQAARLPHKGLHWGFIPVLLAAFPKR